MNPLQNYDENRTCRTCFHWAPGQYLVSVSIANACPEMTIAEIVSSGRATLKGVCHERAHGCLSSGPFPATMSTTWCGQWKPSDASDERSVAELDLNTIARNALRRARIETIGDLCAKTETEIRQLRNVGANTFDNIVRALAREGRRLKASLR